MHPDDTVIHDYVDDALGPDRRDEVRRHLETCVPCQALAEDLVVLTRAARALGPIEPPERVWSRVQDAIGRSSARQMPRASWTSRAALATAAALVLAAVVGVMLRRTPAAVPAGTTSASNAAQSVEDELNQAEAHYEKAIEGLEQIANDQKSALDPRTADTLQKNLAVIDQAITESRAAVRAQPDSEPAQASLLENFRTKISVLQDTLALINEMRKGNQTGAARIVAGLGRQS
jgi:hypothetical protein